MVSKRVKGTLMLSRQQGRGSEGRGGKDSDLELRRTAGNDVEWKGQYEPIVDSRGADTVSYRSKVGEERQRSKVDRKVGL